MSRYVKLGLIGVIVIAAAAMVVAAVGGLSTTAVAPAKIAGSGGGNNAPLPLNGGETCATATVIGALPYTDSGTTAGAVNDYDEVCPYTGSTSPDVVYSYTPASNTSVSISLCTPGTSTDYDTKLYVYQGSCPGTVTGCSDDACSSPLYSSYVSELGNIALTGGTTYYFVVDGYGGASGNYTIYVEEFITQNCPCPPGSDLYEGTIDPTCGNPGASDPSGGCNTNPNDPGPYMVPISCNTTICGTTSTFTDAGTDSRDTDWFELNLPQADTIRVTLTSAANLYLFDLSGEYNCGGVGVAQTYTEPGNCAGSGEMVISGVAGPNWIWVGPTTFGAAAGITCPTEYILTVDCDVVPVDLESITIE
jgi:hypothetical protein